MKPLLIVLILLTISSGCQQVTSQMWRASEENGDKPGIGFELEKRGEKIAGTAYLLDPNFPHDFSHGVKRRMTLVEQSPLAISFRVVWDLQTKETLRFTFDKPNWPDSFQTIVTEVGGKEPTEPQTYTFAKAK